METYASPESAVLSDDAATRIDAVIALLPDGDLYLQHWDAVYRDDVRVEKQNAALQAQVESLAPLAEAAEAFVRARAEERFERL